MGQQEEKYLREKRVFVEQRAVNGEVTTQRFTRSRDSFGR